MCLSSYFEIRFVKLVLIFSFFFRDNKDIAVMD